MTLFVKHKTRTFQMRLHAFNYIRNFKIDYWKFQNFKQKNQMKLNQIVQFHDIYIFIDCHDYQSTQLLSISVNYRVILS